jgi:hypothetical protein
MYSLFAAVLNLNDSVGIILKPRIIICKLNNNIYEARIYSLKN